MKKLFLLSTMLLVCLLAQAQSLKVNPTMKKGDVKTYAFTTTMNVAGKDMTFTSDAVYNVTEETADGFVVNYQTKNFKSDVDSNDLVNRLVTASSELMAQSAIDIVVDKEGKVKGIKNFETVKKNMSEAADKMFDEMFKAAPEAESIMPKEKLKEQVMASATEEAMVKSLQESTSALALNGMTLSTGSQDEYVNDQGLKMKRMYFVSPGGKITMTANLDMDKEALKKMIIEKVSEMAPDQAEMIKQNIDMVLSSGMLKIEATEKGSYEMGNDGWMKAISVEKEINTMGQKMTVKSVGTLK
ncbi:MAG: hypothetical protein IKZ48_10170 [Prevotella sp.]|nr:hypothetical protein [Prevotella sp.]